MNAAVTDRCGGATPLGWALTQAILNSLGTGAVTTGVFFVTTQAYGFSPLANFLLAFVAGATYVGAALTIGPALDRLIARSPVVTHRRALVALLAALGAVCAVPVVVARPWTMWVFMALYAPLTGAIWPIVEGYISGGRRGAPLRRAIGAFNMCWAVAVAAAYWLMAPLLDAGRPLLIIAALGALHVVAAGLALRLPQSPGTHMEIDEGAHPANYTDLLAVFRRLLLLSYVLLYVISPLLPGRLTSLGVDIAWQTPLASAWMMSRIVMFALLQRWGGWHGRWRTPAWTGCVMLAGFTLFVFAPTALTLTLALALFGVGIGGVYAAALYYAMEVGADAVGAGGKHEALIGLGYACGPLAGIVSWSLVDVGLLPASRASAVVLGVVMVIAVVVGAHALKTAHASIRSGTHRDGGCAA